MYNSKNARWNVNMPEVLKPTPKRRVSLAPWTLFKAVFVGTLGLVAKEYEAQGRADTKLFNIHPYPGTTNVAGRATLAHRMGGTGKVETIYGNLGSYKTNVPVAYKHYPKATRNWKIIPTGFNITGRFPTQKSDDAAICAAGAWFYNWTGIGGQFVGAQCGFTMARILGLLKFLDSSAFQASFVVLGAYLLAQRRAKFLADEDEKWRASELAKMNARMSILRDRAARQNTKANTKEIREDIAKLGQMINALRKGDATRRRSRRTITVNLRRAETQASRLVGAITRGEVVIVPNQGGGIRVVPVAARNSESQANGVYNAFNAAYPLPRMSSASPRRLGRAASVPVRNANRTSPSLKRASSAPVHRASSARRNALRTLATAINNAGSPRQR